MHEGPLVVFAGGGTGGHLYPALAIADALRARRPEVRVLFVGARRGIEARVLPERGEAHELLPVRGIDRARPIEALRAILGMGTSVVRLARRFREQRPEVVVVTGGYAGAPAGFVAGMQGIPLVLQEQNSVPGIVTRVLTRWATEIHLAFPEAADRLPLGRDRVRLSGNPVRPSIALGRDEARRGFGLPGEGKVLLVVGGSQGARALNHAVLDAVSKVGRGEARRPEGLHLLWATGPAHLEAVRTGLREAGDPAWVRPLGYIEEMPAALAAADLALCRAGAIFLAELVENGLPALLVPLPTAAANHQLHNARAMAAHGAAVVMEETELDGTALWREVERLLAAPGTLAGMRDAARALARPGAADAIARSLERYLPEPTRRVG